MRVAVFCSCRDLASPFLMDEMEQMGRALAQSGHEVIFGGTGGGCMGALARGVREAGGRIIGVVPKAWADRAFAEGLSEVHEVEHLSARKARLNALAEAFVIFPGGLGTLDEAFTVLAMKSVGEITAPIVIYNVMDVWTPVLHALDLMVAQRLIDCDLNELFVTLDNIPELLGHLAGPRS